MKHSKPLTALGLFFILVIALVVGSRFTIPVADASTDTSTAPQANAPAATAPQQTTGQPQAKVSIQKTPYGRIITTQKTGTESGVHYRIIDQHLLPQKNIDTRHQESAPEVHIQKTPYGKTIVIQQSDHQGGKRYEIIQSSTVSRMTPEQAQKMQQQFIEQEHQMEQAFQHDMQQMMQQMPPIRFDIPQQSNPNQ